MLSVPEEECVGRDGWRIWKTATYKKTACEGGQFFK
ncbi:Protein of unknown function [Bacillus mycoides]|uniref:Uncharacterized protein n=1 Tax=Bacillus mycoides TaxID=1405 RepID=A0A1G4EXK9_BACMY|nr:Protein of unknown function [Bacillus mycoides]